MVRSSGQRQSINAISAVTASGAFWAATYSGKLNAESFGLFLRNFMKGPKHKVMPVVDGHPAHKANLVKARLTGQDGEPCPGWWVHWELEDAGDGMIGSMDKSVSLTDAAGWAECLYFGPADNQPGSCRIQARVVLS